MKTALKNQSVVKCCGILKLSGKNLKKVNVLNIKLLTSAKLMGVNKISYHFSKLHITMYFCAKFHVNRPIISGVMGIGHFCPLR